MNTIKWIVDAEYQSDYTIYLKFNDGLEGNVNLENDLNLPIFSPLKDINTFKDFKLSEWTIEWHNGADMAPEFLYEKLLSSLELVD